MSPVQIPLEIHLLYGAPLAALLLGFFVFRPLGPRAVFWPIMISCGVVTGAAWALAARAAAGWGIDATLAVWMPLPDLPVTAGVRYDGIAAAVLAMVTFVGSMIHLYAAGYMKDDPGFNRFFLIFHLFFLSMIGLLLSNNLVQFYLFWEGVGVASYLLIGFWAHKASARRAALQAFLVNRIGDAGLLFAILVLISQVRETRFALMFALLPNAEPALVALAGLLLAWAAAAKSAQFPLYFWLPDAMEGPTPASALMHAATMVTAGIYLLVRTWPLVSAVQGLPELIAAAGAVTSAGAAVLAFTQTDLKRVLAYSTVSHLGLMAFALGLGQVGAALFHLVTHGFFKAALFLCAGNIAHGLGQSTASVSDVGGLWKRMPATAVCFWIAALSLAGIPPLAGFFSKDAIVDAALHAGPGAAAAAGLVAFGSALYILRFAFLAFHGKERGAHHPHEAEPVMAAPLAFLTLGAAVVGFGKGGFGRLILSGAMPSPEALAIPAFTWGAFAFGTALAAAGAATAFYWTKLDWEWNWRERRPRLAAWFAADFGWRWAVGWLAGAGAGAAAWFSDRVDRRAWDGLIEASPGWVRDAGQRGRALATGQIADYLWWLVAGAAVILMGSLR